MPDGVSTEVTFAAGALVAASAGNGVVPATAGVATWFAAAGAVWAGFGTTTLWDVAVELTVFGNVGVDDGTGTVGDGTTGRGGGKETGVDALGIDGVSFPGAVWP